jgi:hypothetical protein
MKLGASWDNRVSSLCEHKGNDIYTKVPVLLLDPVEVDTDAKETEPGIYNCPLFYTANRTGTFITTIGLPTTENSDKWIRGGVAMILDYN